MPIKLVVFDMAGTTVKDDSNVGLAFKSALQNHQYTIPLQEIMPIMGYEKNEAIRMMLHKHEPDQEKITNGLVASIHQEFVGRMIDHYQNGSGIAALPDVESTFTELKNKGIKIGLNTGFSRIIANTIIRRLHWDEKELFDVVVGSDEVEFGRPNPLMIRKMMTDLGITDPAEVAKVGDTEVDIREGKNAGCRYVIGITTGAFTKEELEKYHPTHIIHNISELLPIIHQPA